MLGLREQEGKEKKRIGKIWSFVLKLIFEGKERKGWGGVRLLSFKFGSSKSAQNWGEGRPVIVRLSLLPNLHMTLSFLFLPFSKYCLIYIDQFFPSISNINNMNGKHFPLISFFPFLHLHGALVLNLLHLKFRTY